MKTSSAKDKGRRLQKWVGEQISKLTGLPFGHDCPIESRGMGQNGVDVRLDREALKLFPYSVECKNCETWSVPAWIKQAKENLIPGTNWLLFIKRNHHEEIVVLDARLFFKLLSKKRTRR